GSSIVYEDGSGGLSVAQADRFSFLHLAPGPGVTSFAPTSDSRHAVFAAPVGGGPTTSLFSVPLDGSAAPLLLDPSSAQVTSFQLAPDGSFAVYLVNEGARTELYRVPTDASAPPVKLNATLVANGNVVSFALSADGQRVVYLADQSVNEVFDL